MTIRQSRHEFTKFVKGQATSGMDAFQEFIFDKGSIKLLRAFGKAKGSRVDHLFGRKSVWKDVPLNGLQGLGCL